MSALRARFRQAAAGVAQALGSSRPGVELVRVDQPELPATRPAPLPLPALPAPPWPVCPRCRSRHEPRPLPGRSGNRGGGLSAYREMHVLPDPTLPQPLGRDPAHNRAVLRDTVNPWRASSPDPPPPSVDMADLRDELHTPHTYWWER